MNKIQNFLQKLLIKCITILKVHTIDYRVSIKDEAGDNKKIQFEKAILRLLKKFDVGGDLKLLQSIEIKCDCNEYPLITIKKLIL